ncbi:MAG: methyltransferase domain-containing protein [Anaerolineales bacterium]|nr:methyltransferase domain-containing protein [Anaerolineales bacterium]
MTITHKDVRNYYDENTRLFLAFSNSKQAQNIHRSLWTDDTQTLEDALNVTNERIRVEIESIAPIGARIADLGCGVGAGLFYIVPRLQEPAPALGVTISPVQAQLANQFTKQIGLENQILFAEGNFIHMPLKDETLDVIFSVEAIVHTAEQEQYFQETSRLLRKGGKLIIVDDYQAARPLSPAETRWLNTFKNGWHVPGVITTEQATTFAKQHQLRLLKNDNLTPYLRLRNLPNFLARTLRFIGEHIPIKHTIVSSMLGSMALQQCLYTDIIEYRFLVFEKI